MFVFFKLKNIFLIQLPKIDVFLRNLWQITPDQFFNGDIMLRKGKMEAKCIMIIFFLWQVFSDCFQILSTECPGSTRKELLTLTKRYCIDCRRQRVMHSGYVIGVLNAVCNPAKFLHVSFHKYRKSLSVHGVLSQLITHTNYSKRDRYRSATSLSRTRIQRPDGTLLPSPLARC